MQTRSADEPMTTFISCIVCDLLDIILYQVNYNSDTLTNYVTDSYIIVLL
jgi:hypothetical protein